MDTRRIETLVIAAVAVHSIVLGIGMLTIPDFLLSMAGMTIEGSGFFVAQAGVMLLILGTAYLIGTRYRPFAWLLVGSKTAAVFFLISRYYIEGKQLNHLLLAIGDGLMGCAVAIAILVNVLRPVTDRTFSVEE